MSQESDPNTVIERVDLQSLDVAEEKRQELLRLFPDVRTEGGTIDFDRLKLTLGATVDVGKERYGLTWPGKAELSNDSDAEHRDAAADARGKRQLRHDREPDHRG